jgi:tRNA threonylcarbamoyladenosine biosynthesis protein TsaE
MTIPFVTPQDFTLNDIHVIARTIVEACSGGDVILLTGEMGAGKTTLAKSIASVLGVDATVTSPTFTLMNVYPTTHAEITTFMHMDTYRMTRETELNEIGFETYVGEPHTLCLIEWPEKFPEAWQGANRLHSFTITGTRETRTIQSTIKG